MKRLFLFVLLLSVAFSMKARTVDSDVALQVAQNFWFQTTHQPNTPMIEVSKLAGLSEVYVFTVSPKGFVIVAADDLSRPILGFSANSVFDPDNIPIQLREWLEADADEIVWLRSHDVRQSSITENEWSALLSDSPLPEYSETAVAPMVTTTWSQSPRYNNLCPYDDGASQHAVTGCVATAMAQVMKYWNYPVRGVGSYSYVDPTYGLQSADFGNTTYQWSLMPANLSSSTPANQINAVATLMYHCGVAVEMEYGVSGSGAVGIYPGSNPPYACGNKAFVDFFGYKSSATGVDKLYYTDAEWFDLIKDELDAARPVMYTGRDSTGGHAFVCDGYNNSNYLHFNWGWGGYCDGYYPVGSLNPSPGGTGGNPTGQYNLQNKCIVGLMPSALRLDKQMVSFPQNGGSEVVYVNCGASSSSWSASANQPWVTLSPSSGSGSFASTAMTVSAAPNGSSAERYATVTVIQGTDTALLQVIQLSCNAGDMCSLTVALEDSYGDGWNGASISLVSMGGAVYGSCSIQSGDAESFTIPVCPDSVRVVWHAGGYDNECSYTIYNANGVLLLSGSGARSSDFVISEPCADFIVSEFPWIDDFESAISFSPLSFVDADGDGYCWDNDDLEGYGHNSDGVISSASYINNVGPLTPDNWMILPAMQLPVSATDFTLTWFDQGVDPDYANENYAVYIATSKSIADFLATTPVFSDVSTSQWLQRSVDLSDYAGQTIYIAFRHFNTSDQFRLLIDDIRVGQVILPCDDITTFPMVEDFEDELDRCWTVYSANESNADDLGIYSYSAYAHAGSSSFRFSSYDNASDYNQYLITPPLALSQPVTFSFYYKKYSYGSESFKVLYSTTDNNVRNLNHVLSEVSDATSDYQRFSVTVPAEARYIAINYCSNFQYYLFVDDIVISDSVAPVVTYNVQGQPDNATHGSVSGGGIFNLGDTATLLASANAGFRFSQWSNGSTDNPLDVVVSSDLTLTAQYSSVLDANELHYDNGTYCTQVGVGTPFSWAVRFNADDYAGYSYISSVRVFDAVSDVFTIKIYQGGTMAPGTLLHTQSATMSATGQWVEIPLSSPVSLSGTDPVWIVLSNASYSHPAAAATYAGNDDGGWYSIDGSNWYHVTSSLYYSWMIRAVLSNSINYTITASSANPSMGSVSGGGSYPSGATATLAATANNGYHFVRWQDGVTTNPRTITVTGNATYMATFAADSYTVSVSANNSSMGSVSGGGSYTYGATATLAATANNGYHFVQWQDGVTTNPRTITVTGNATYVATFAADSYTVSVSANNSSMGSVSGGGSYTYGATATLSATANNGYHFVQWQDGVTTNPRTITVTGNATYMATFAADTYTILASAADPSMGSVTGGGEYDFGSTVTLNAVPNDGFHFVQWSNGETSNPYVFTASQDLTIEALFASNVSIDALEPLNVQVYPNPTTGVVSVVSDRNVVRLEVLDILGHVLISQTEINQDGTSNVIDLHSLAPGAYLLRVITPSSVDIMRIVKQ